MSAQPATVLTTDALQTNVPLLPSGSAGISSMPAKGKGASQPGKKNHWPGGRKNGTRAQRDGNVTAAAFSDLYQQKCGAWDAAKEKTREAREAVDELEKVKREKVLLENALTAAGQALDAVRAVGDARADIWTQGQYLVYQDSRISTTDLSTVWKMLSLVDGALALVTIITGWISGFSWLVGMGVFWYSALTLTLAAIVFAVMYDLASFLSDRGNGGIFRSLVIWRYRFDGYFVHEHLDNRTDVNSLSKMKHTARYAQFLLEKGFGFRKILVFKAHSQSVVTSMELYVQIANPKNMDPYLSGTDARSAFQRSAANNQSVNIDKNLVLRGSYVYQETVCLAFFNYLRLKEDWSRRDFLPSLPQ